MTKGDWLDLTVLARKKYNLLGETMDLSCQLGDAMDRNDDVSVRMLVAMRHEPILGLEELQRAIASRLESLTEEERSRVAALDGGAAPQGGDEALYANQANSARRLLERVLELDQRLNRRMAGDNSFYKK